MSESNKLLKQIGRVFLETIIATLENNDKSLTKNVISRETTSDAQDDNVLDNYCDFEHHKKINVNMSDLSSEGDNNINVDIQELKDDLYDNKQDDETETDNKKTNKKVIYADDGTNLDWNDYREMEKYRRD